MNKRTLAQPETLNNGQTAPDPAAFDPAVFERSAETVAVTPAAPDPFNPAALRLTGNDTAALGVRKHLLAVPVRKPGPSEFVRVHADPAYRLETAVVELKDNLSETYLVARPLWPELAGEATFAPRVLFTATTRQGTVFLWPCRLPRPDGRRDEWQRTAMEAVELATKCWVRMVADMGLGAYQVFEATGQLSEPEWPDMPFAELLRIAFRDRYIDSPSHPILRRLRGEV